MERRPNVAVAVDFSAQSDIAIEHARSIAHLLDRDLVLVHVARESDVTAPGWATTSASGEALMLLRKAEEESRRRARERLEALRIELSDGQTVRSAVVDDFPDSGLCMAAVETDSDLLVVGTHGRTGLNWFLLGSVALRVVRACERDVLISRGPARAQGYKRILVATDFSHSSQRALDRAIELADPQAEIAVVYFYGHDPGMVDAAEAFAGLELDESILRDLHDAGENLIASRRRQGGPSLRFFAHPSRATTGIVHWLESHPCDLVALGSHGRRGFRRWALGSVAEVVARRAPCSVLVAKGSANKQLT